MMSLLINKTIPRYKIISTPPPPLSFKKNKNKQKTNKTNKQTKKPKNDKSTLYCHYFLVFSTSVKLNHL